ncbi:MAG: Ig-like domain-containing protein [Bacteroidia bacterium]|nr:Ig-like domain-containing protein [Bacteroidia bacterium]
MVLLQRLLIYTLILFVASCASKVRPAGGDKDETPPVALNFSPSLYSTNFNSTEVIIEFDEYVKLEDPFNQIVVSPIITPNPKFRIKKKSLIIEIPDSLQANTTYNINFGNSIVDVHESNVAPNFQYVFSTGSVIDSLKISGKLVLAKDNSPQKESVVMLHKSLNDTVFLSSPPSYIGRTNELGAFQLKNISPGRYNLFAIKEDNSNYMYDRPDELIAFYHTSIVVPDSSSYYLRLFESIPQKVKIIEKQSAALGKHVIVFNTAVDKALLTIAAVEQETEFRTDLGTRGDTLFVLWKDFSLEKFTLAVSYDGKSLDSLKISNAISVKQRGGTGSRTTPKIQVKTNMAKGPMLHRHLLLSLSFNNPILTLNNDSISLLADSTALADFQLTLDSVSDFKASSSQEFEDDVFYMFTFLPGAFKDYYGNTNDTIIFLSSLKPERQYGSIQINLTSVDLEKDKLLLQVIEGEDKIYRQVKIKDLNTEVSFLEANTYSLRLVNDINENGVWDTGDFENKIQPEYVLNYSAPINVRANWDMVIDWKIR